MAQRKTRVTASILAAALFTLAGIGPGGHRPLWTIDTTIERHVHDPALLSKVTGSFNKFSGTIVHDPANRPPARPRPRSRPPASTPRTSGAQSSPPSADFFDVAEHPTLTFESTKVSHEGGKLKIDGNLTMHGVTKPVTLEGEFLGAGPTASGERAGFEVTGKLDRKEFGILWNKVADQGGAVLGDDVQNGSPSRRRASFPRGSEGEGGLKRGKAADKKGSRAAARSRASRAAEGEVGRQPAINRIEERQSNELTRRATGASPPARFSLCARDGSARLGCRRRLHDRVRRVGEPAGQLARPGRAERRGRPPRREAVSARRAPPSGSRRTRWPWARRPGAQRWK